MWLVLFTKRAQKDAARLEAAGLDAKARSLVDAVRRDPFVQPPRFERLRGNLEGMYSRRVNIQHRFVYVVDEEPVERDGISYDGTVKVLSMWSHYDGLR